ncbi:MAG: hypothetical protein LBC54_03010 [Bacteroidales bacterium OttesenSCG-928-I14]|jgi:hypothetical protein|nr:hypothetical protein [Bacteroidales bacterium OttesenSCG-928-I14]
MKTFALFNNSYLRPEEAFKHSLKMKIILSLLILTTIIIAFILEEYFYKKKRN